MKPKSTLVFIMELKHRAREAGWDQGAHQIMQFKENGVQKKLLTQYNQINIETLKNAYASWQQGENKENLRSTQNNKQMQKCIMNTLTEQACLQVMPFQKEYTTEDGIIHAPLLFKTIMRITTIDNIAVAAVLRDNLHNLDAKMVDDLPKFHFYFHTNYDQLVGCRETLNNPIHHLFKAYLKVECSGFVTFAQDMQNQYYHQQGAMHDITYNRLITLMENQYNIMISNGTWKAKSHEREQIVALTAEISHLKGNLKLSKPLLNKLKSVARNAGHEGKKREEKKRNKTKKVDNRN